MSLEPYPDQGGIYPKEPVTGYAAVRDLGIFVVRQPSEVSSGTPEVPASDPSSPGTEPVPAEDSKKPDFKELNKEQFFAQFVAVASERGLDLANLLPQQREPFNVFAHTRIYNYHLAKHQHEWANDVEYADPPPLPGVQMRKRVQQFYANRSIQLWVTDNVHATKLKDIHQDLEPAARKYRDKIPEISTVYDLKQLAETKGYIDASEMLNDLIAVYGQAMNSLAISKEQRRRDIANAEARRNRPPVSD